MVANCRIAIDLNIFEHLRQSGDNGLAVQDLAAKCNADITLICKSTHLSKAGNNKQLT